MLLENHGNKIEKIIFGKNKRISMIFDNQSELIITDDVFSHYYLYEGKSLSNEEIEEIKKYLEFSNAKSYCLKILQNKSYTKKQLTNKLKERGYKDELIIRLVDHLQKCNLINDKNYTDDKVISYDAKLFGKNKIISELIKSGINSSIINGIDFEDDKEYSKAVKSLEKYQKITKNKSVNQRKRDSYRILVNKGFEEDIAKKAISNFDFSNIQDNEEEILKKQIEKYIISHHICLDEYKDKQKIISYFIRKGFDYSLIMNILGGL